MRRKIKKADLMSMLYDLCFGSCNDAARLLYLEADKMETLGELDLRLVSELKRNTNGSIEIKLAGRTDLIQLLSDMLEDDSSGIENFFGAIDRAAGAIKVKSDENS